jgi:hypothetical protein
LPLYEGRMIGQFDFSDKGWVSGKGRSAVWREIPWERKVIEPQYLLSLETWVSRAESGAQGAAAKVAFMDVTSATNARTMIAAAVGVSPCGNSAPVLYADPSQLHGLAAVLNSYAYDFAARARCGGLHLNYFVVEETPLPKPGQLDALEGLSLSLGGAHECFAGAWLAIARRQNQSWRGSWALARSERLRVGCVLEAAVAHFYELGEDGMRWVLAGCDHPAAQVGSDAFAARLNPKGFWRVDKSQDPELRHSVLTQVAFHDLQRIGLEEFLNQNDGEGWMIPETLRLADYGLGHDDRAKEHQPVASRVGPRFLPWQLEQGGEESWEECARHAERIEALLGSGTPSPDDMGEPTTIEEPPAGAPVGDVDLFGQTTEADLFGNAAPPPGRRRR